MPSPKMLAEAEAILDAESGRIRQGYLIRENDPERSAWIDGKEVRLKRQPWDSANGYFQREAYALIRRMIREQKEGATAIQIGARQSTFLPNRPVFGKAKFLWGLLAIDPEADCLGKGAKKARRFARLFAHADRNLVPPEYLIGFSKQIGGSRTLEREFKTPSIDPSLRMEPR